MDKLEEAVKRYGIQGHGINGTCATVDDIEILFEAARETATLRKMLEVAREALKPFALACRSVEPIFDVTPQLKKVTGLIAPQYDVAKCLAEQRVSWADYAAAQETLTAIEEMERTEKEPQLVKNPSGWGHE